MLERYEKIKQTQQTPEVYQDLGQRLQSQGYLEEAIACYRQAIAFQGEAVHLWYYKNLGEALLEVESKSV